MRMTSYRIDPDGAWTIVNGVVANSTAISDSLKGFPAAMEDAAEQSMSTDVGSALEQFANSQKSNLTSLVDHVPASAYGLATALNAYESGDQQMASDAVTNAVTAASTGDFSTFEKK
jgi:hypothetical protein